jgi:hypothetical protein
MKNILTTMIIIILLSSSNIFAQVIRQETTKKKTDTTEKKFSINVNFSISSGSSYYDMDNKLITRIYTNTPYAVDSSYLIELKKYTFEVLGEYKLSNELFLYGNIPFSLNYLDETTKLADAAGNTMDSIRNYSRNHLEYLALGTKYIYSFGKFHAGGNLEFHFPSSFDKHVITNDSNEFLSNGAFELHIGTRFGYQLKKTSFAAGITYQHRTLELSDQLLLHAETSITTVPKTLIKVNIDYMKCLSPLKDYVLLNPRKTVTHEDYLHIGFLFGITFDNNISARFAYQIPIWGRNTWNSAVTYFSVGYDF